MFIGVQTFNEKHKRKVRQVLIKLVGDALSVMGFFYYRDVEKLSNNVILFKSDIKKGTSDDEMIKTIINKLDEWDGELLYTDNFLNRSSSQKQWDQISKIFDYFNCLPLSKLCIVNPKGEYIFNKNINIQIQYKHNPSNFIPYNFIVQKQINNTHYIEEINERYTNNLCKIEIGLSINPQNLHLTVLNMAHYMEHLIIQQIRNNVDCDIIQFNGFTSCTGFVNVYVIFEYIHYDKVYKVIEEILQEPLQEHDSTENVRLAIETFTNQQQLIDKSKSVLTAQFCYNNEIYKDKIDIKYIDNLLHNYYTLQYYVISYSGKDKFEKEIKEMQLISHDNNHINKKLKKEFPIPNIKDLKPETLYKFDVMEDYQFIQMLRFLEVNNIQFTINNGDLFVHNRRPRNKDLRYKLFSEQNRFLNIGMNCVVNQMLVKQLQTDDRVQKANKYVRILTDLLTVEERDASDGSDSSDSSGSE